MWLIWNGPLFSNGRYRAVSEEISADIVYTQGRCINRSAAMSRFDSRRPGGKLNFMNGLEYRRSQDPPPWCLATPLLFPPVLKPTPAPYPTPRGNLKFKVTCPSVQTEFTGLKHCKGRVSKPLTWFRALRIPCLAFATYGEWTLIPLFYEFWGKHYIYTA